MMIVWIAIKFAFLGSLVAAFLAFAVVWAVCFLVSIIAIRRLMGLALTLCYALAASIFFTPGYFIAAYTLNGTSPGQAKFFWAVTAIYFLIFITRRQAMPAFLVIARRQTGEWNSS